MYLPDNLETILTVTIKRMRERRTFYRDHGMTYPALRMDGSIWTLMDVRDAITGNPSALIY